MLLWISAGLFHHAHHYFSEVRLGVAAIFLVQSECYSDLDVFRFTPVPSFSLVQALHTGLCEKTSRIPKRHFHESDMAVVNILLLAITCQEKKTKAGCFPQTFRLSYPSYNVVLMSSSTRFAAGPRRASDPARLLAYEPVKHNRFVTHCVDEDTGAQTDMHDLFYSSSAD